jgi:heptosyltransferase-2
MARAEKILVRGVNWLGDAVMTTPALQRLREAKPQAHLTLLTPAKLADLWRGHPSLDATMTFAAGEGVFAVARRLRAERFDTAVVFPNSPRSALEVFLARIPRRIGYARNGRSLFLTDAVPVRADAVVMHKRTAAEVQRRIADGRTRETFSPAAHHTRDYLRLVSVLGANETPLAPLLRVSDEEVAAFKTRFGMSGDAPWFGLNAGAEYGAAKRWPRERFIEAALQLHTETKCRWLLFGGQADRDLTDEIARALTPVLGADGVVNVAGETSLRELCAGLRACALVITNDTGPMHVAAAVGTPVVVPFGSTAPELTGPMGAADGPHQLLIGAAPCAPCFLRECPVDFRCLNSISVEQVVGAARQAWRARGGH